MGGTNFHKECKGAGLRGSPPIHSFFQPAGPKAAAPTPEEGTTTSEEAPTAEAANRPTHGSNDSRHSSVPTIGCAAVPTWTAIASLRPSPWHCATLARRLCLSFSKNGCQHAICFKCLPAFCGLRRRKCYKSPTNSRSDEQPAIGCKRIGRSTRRPARRTYAKTVIVRLASFLSSIATVQWREAFIYEDWEDYLANLRRPAQSNRDGGYGDHVSLHLC